MSDFHQQGLIATLQNLQETNPARLEGELEEFVKQKPVSLVLPCHASEIGKPALEGILMELQQVRFVEEVVVSMNGLDAEKFATAQRLFSALPQRVKLLWNDGPKLHEMYAEFERRGVARFTSGKGFNLWAAIGTVQNEQGVIVTQDCDVLSFSRGLLARLCYAATHPEFGYSFNKLYYSRVTDRIYGRVSRLFLNPLLYALVRVAGHHPLLDFLTSFRYPLSGECAMATGLAREVAIEPDWGLEIGMLCGVFRRVSPREVCQVGSATHYDHKHQPLHDGEGDGGLVRMSREIFSSLLFHLEKEGIVTDEAFMGMLGRSYKKQAEEALVNYRNLARLNGLEFDEDEERGAIGKFGGVMETASLKMDVKLLPAWTSVPEDLRNQFLDVAGVRD